MALPTAVNVSLSRANGPFLSSAGNLYVIGDHLTVAGRISASKATDPTASWSVVATLDLTSYSSDLNSAAVRGSIFAYQDGDNIHISTGYKTATDLVYRYHVFSMASDTFTTSNELIYTVAVTGLQSEGGGIVRRSDGTIVVAHGGPTASVMGTAYQRQYYARRSTGGVWTTAVTYDPAGAFSYVICYGVQIISGSQRTYFVYATAYNSTTVYVRVLSSGNVLQTNVTGSNFSLISLIGQCQFSIVSNGSASFVHAWRGKARLTATDADVPTLTITTGDLIGANDATPCAMLYDSADGANGTLYYILQPSQTANTVPQRKTSTNHGVTLSSAANFGSATSSYDGSISGAGGYPGGGIVFQRGNNIIGGFISNFFGFSSGWGYNEVTLRTVAGATSFLYPPSPFQHLLVR